jgi:putative ABC transport system permease protein
MRAAAKGMFSAAETSIDIVVRSTEERLEDDIDEAIGVLRGLHKLRVGQENDFEILSQREISDSVGGFLQYITFFGLFCGIIALLAAGIGVMNIMLVTVKERTREIGIRKAVGARRTDILRQFMIEAITICQIGAMIGILGGVIVGLLLGVALDAPVTIPWTSVAVSAGICLAIGIVFGSFPAWIASGLDPVDALRYE